MITCLVPMLLSLTLQTQPFSGASFPLRHVSSRLSMALTYNEIEDTKERLLSDIDNGAALSADGMAYVDLLEANPQPVPGDTVYFMGRFELRTAHQLAAALPQVKGKQIRLFVDAELAGDGKLTVDLGGEMQIHGIIQQGMIPGDDVGMLRATLDSLPDVLPEKKAERVSTLRAVFVDESMLLLREQGTVDGREPLVIVLTRLPPEVGDDLKAGLETEDDYS